MSGTGNGDETKNNKTTIFNYLIIAFGAVGILGLILYAIQASNIAQGFSIAGVTLAVAGGALMAGGLLGFLFGIPRTLQRESNGETGQSQGQDNEEKGVRRGASIQSNTNLEQISDWLTKILVGVGLTQISAVPGAIKEYANYISPGLGNFQNSEAFAVGLLFYFLIGGFIISYLLTRLYLPRAFSRAEQDISEQIAKVKSAVSEIEKQAQMDARALSIIQHQLNPSAGEPPIKQEDINKAIAQASTQMRAQIFYIAHDERKANWREEENKPKMERTIPIFRALIASDTNKEYHANHGQLGFILKDQRQPNWVEAETELTEAIRIRDSQNQGGTWLYYEFNRAICRIYLDKAFKQRQKSNEKTRQAILADIKEAATVPDLADLIRQQEPIPEWLEINGIKMSELET